MVEIVGRVKEVKDGFTWNNRPYIFINFGNWKGEIVKISIWSEGLSIISDKPDDSWVGNWISVSGLLEPPYTGKGYTHLSVNITQNNQMHIITEKNAEYRLKAVGFDFKGPSESPGFNIDIVKVMKGEKENSGNTLVNPVPIISKNEDVLNGMRNKSASLSQNTQPPRQTSASQNTTRQSPTQKHNSNNYGWIIIAIIFFLVIITMSLLGQ
jgi:hypothetical protein